MPYSSENIQDAVVKYVTAVDEISVRDVVSIFRNPKSTLYDKIMINLHRQLLLFRPLHFHYFSLIKTKKYSSRASVAPVVSKKGRQFIFEQEDGEAIEDWVRKMADAGFPVTNEDLLDSI
jgi:hypothetical protein